LSGAIEEHPRAMAKNGNVKTMEMRIVLSPAPQTSEIYVGHYSPTFQEDEAVRETPISVLKQSYFVVRGGLQTIVFRELQLSLSWRLGFAQYGIGKMSSLAEAILKPNVLWGAFKDTGRFIGIGWHWA
jgi:hypothetical protein